MTAKKTSSITGKGSKEKEEKEPRIIRVDFRVSAKEDLAIKSLMRRYGKNKTEIILKGIDLLRKRGIADGSVVPESHALQAEFVQNVILLLKALPKTSNLSVADKNKIETLNAWASRLLNGSEVPVQDTSLPLSEVVEPDDDYINTDELLSELKQMADNIDSLRGRIFVLQHSSFREETLKLIEKILQSHEAIFKAIN